MTDPIFAKQAEAACNSALTTAHAGGGEGRPFWNPESFQFMYVPAFQFQPIPGTKNYRYHAVDEAGTDHTFEADSAKALLTPVWGEIPEGVVKLTVYALDEAGQEKYLAGARTFFKLASFPADLPEAACSYRDCVIRSYDYAFGQSVIQHWLTHGTPDPDYDLNVYPSKMISWIVRAMLTYERISPVHAEEALKIAVNAADYLIGLTPEDGPLAGVPPTYQIDFRDHPESRDNLTGAERLHTVMLQYPAQAGLAYIELEKRLKNGKYLEAAKKIGAFYQQYVSENGSWYLIFDYRTGEPLCQNFTDPLGQVLPFLRGLYQLTGETVWKELADGALRYVENCMMVSYEWEGQFEDSFCSHSYSNLTHYCPTALAGYYAAYYPEDELKMQAAEELMRFAEDQFVVWKRSAPWNLSGFDTSQWLTPCGLEQYAWHVPIDASTADLMLGFLHLYQAGRGALYLEKAKALADAITRTQQPDGMIPTHWMNEEHLHGKNYWINCQFFTAEALTELADFLDAHEA